jgi:hypothetical protein
MTLRQRPKALAPGLTVRSVLEKFASIQMIDVYLPTTEGNELLLRRYTQPDKDQLLLLSRLNLTLPDQPKTQLFAPVRGNNFICFKNLVITQTGEDNQSLPLFKHSR